MSRAAKATGALLAGAAVAACSPFGVSSWRTEPGAWGVRSLDCGTDDVIRDAMLGQVEAEAGKRCPHGHRYLAGPRVGGGMRGGFTGECLAVEVTATVVCEEKKR